MKAQVIGTIKKILKKETRKTQSNSFTIQQFIINESDGKYNNELFFNCWEDKCTLLENKKVGDKVLVEFYIRCNQAKDADRYYTNLQVINIIKSETFITTNNDFQ